MKTESQKTFHHGFTLTEQELRRIVATATDQLKKVCDSPELFIQAKFRNGTVSSIDSLDELLALENAGSKEVTRLRIAVAEAVPGPKKENPASDEEPWKLGHLVLIAFRNPEQDDDPRPINYIVRGDDRDWVFVTASELEERITKVKSFAPQVYLSPRPTTTSVSSVFAVGLWFGLILTLGAWVQAHKPTNTAHIMESSWKAGTLRDPIEALIIQQKALEADRASLRPGLLLPIAVAGSALIVVLFTLLLQLGRYLFPGFVFSWGDQAKQHDRRQRARQWVLTVIVTGLIISVIAGIIANHLTAIR